MTIARDIRTNEVVGQVLEETRVEVDRTFGAPNRDDTYLRLLTRDGKYAHVPASSVRVEEVR